ncbi:MAG TPA: hypothetical protein PKH79_10365 [Prolixibacteraceae bacterium]|nr:hypothetical protein [Prolixibacteraceae bacterium]HPS13378.1 hypothetical protein [Prolixibacteraceae bacterium]
MKTFIQLLKAIGFVFAYFVVVVLVGQLFPTATDVKPDASAMGALMLHILVNSFFIIYLLKRLSLHGFRLIAATALSVYGIQIYMTQIETWVFIDSFPSITPKWLANIFIGNFVQTVVITLVGYFLWKPATKTEISSFKAMISRDMWWKLALLSVLYMILYFVFGSIVPWRFEVVRNFYHTSVITIGNTELAFIQIARGALWVLFCLPVLFNLKGGKTERYIIVSLMMALLPTILLLMPNSLMPFPIRMAHFVEIFFSNGIFGLCIAGLLDSRKLNRNPDTITVAEQS